MKKIFFLLFLLFCLSAESQYRKLTVGLDISPLISNIVFNYENYEVEKSIKDLYRPAISYSVGIPVNFSINDKIWFTTGVNWVNRAESRRQVFEGYPYPYPFIGTDSTFISLTVKRFVSRKFFDIPVGLNIIIRDNEKLRIYIDLGIAASIMYTTKTKYISYLPDYTEIKVYNDAPNIRSGVRVLPSGFVGSGLEYSIGPKINFIIEPHFNYLFRSTDLSDLHASWVNYYYLGCKFGIRYNL